MEQRIRKDNSEKNSLKNKTSKPKRKKKNNKVIVVILAILLGVLLGVMGVVVVLDRQSAKNNNDNQQQTQATNTLEELLQEEGIIIDTPIVALHYPEKWKNHVRVEKSEDDKYSVRFWGKTEGKEDVLLFDIVFGETNGVILGTIDKTEVYLVYSELEFDDSWTEEEKNEIYAMQEDVNYVIGLLQKEKQFVPSS